MCIQLPEENWKSIEKKKVEEVHIWVNTKLERWEDEVESFTAGQLDLHGEVRESRVRVSVGPSRGQGPTVVIDRPVSISQQAALGLA